MTVHSLVRRVVTGSVFVAAAMTAAPALAQGAGGYVSVGAGFQHRLKAGESDTTYTLWKNGGVFNVAAGVQSKTGLAVEGEYSRFKNASRITASDVTGPAPGTGDVTLDFFFGNLRYTVPAGPVRVYVGGGLGGYKSTLHDLSNTIAQSFGFEANGKNDGIVFAYQARAGLNFHFSSHVGLDAGYRFTHGGDLLFKGTEFGDLTPNGAKMHVLEANLRFGF